MNKNITQLFQDSFVRTGILFAVYSIPVVLLLMTLIQKKYRKYYLPQKFISSLCFLALGIYAALTSDNLDALYKMLPGFLLCIIGDVLLGMYNKKRNKKVFLGGVFVFLMGHIFFIATICTIQRLMLVDFIIPAISLGIVIYLANRTKINLGRLKPFAYFYCLFVSMLFSKGLHVMLSFQTAQTLCLGAGGLLFLTSDLLILFLYFYKGHPWSTHGWNIGTYYYAMFFLAVSIMFA